jgi:hypothetical protein
MLIMEQDYKGLRDDAISLLPQIEKLQAKLREFPDEFVVSRLETFRQLRLDLAKRHEIMSRAAAGPRFGEAEWAALKQDYPPMVNRLQGFERDFASYLAQVKK